jgi:TM2 domain-containing membrane protein YozV
LDHGGQVQYGGKESGEPWRRAVCTLSNGDLAISVSGTEVLHVRRDDVDVEIESGMYRIAGGEGTVFFLPDSGDRFRIDWEGPADVGERIELAASVPVSGPTPGVAQRSKIAAGVLGILLGSFGAHKFYLGQTGLGILYLLFFWTTIPGIVGLIEGIIYLTMTDEAFARKYG